MSDAPVVTVSITSSAKLPRCYMAELRYNETPAQALARVMAQWPGYTPTVYDLNGRLYISTPKEAQ